MVPSNAGEAIIVAFCREALLPLDDCLYALQATIPYLTRSSLPATSQDQRVARGGRGEGAKPPVRGGPIGYHCIDIAEIQTADGKLWLFVVIDRTSKFAPVKRREQVSNMIATEFLRNLVPPVPYGICSLLTETIFSSPITFATNSHLGI